MIGAIERQSKGCTRNCLWSSQQSMSLSGSLLRLSGILEVVRKLCTRKTATAGRNVERDLRLLLESGSNAQVKIPDKSNVSKANLNTRAPFSKTTLRNQRNSI